MLATRRQPASAVISWTDAGRKVPGWTTPARTAVSPSAYQPIMYRPGRRYLRSTSHRERIAAPGSASMIVVTACTFRSSSSRGPDRRPDLLRVNVTADTHRTTMLTLTQESGFCCCAFLQLPGICLTDGRHDALARVGACGYRRAKVATRPRGVRPLL